MAVRLTF